MLTIIGHFPTCSIHMLASLPLMLRQELAYNLTPVDVHRLEVSYAGEGIDFDPIWEDIFFRVVNPVNSRTWRSWLSGSEIVQLSWKEKFLSWVFELSIHHYRVPKYPGDLDRPISTYDLLNVIFGLVNIPLMDEGTFHHGTEAFGIIKYNFHFTPEAHHFYVSKRAKHHEFWTHYDVPRMMYYLIKRFNFHPRTLHINSPYVRKHFHNPPCHYYVQSVHFWQDGHSWYRDVAQDLPDDIVSHFFKNLKVLRATHEHLRFHEEMRTRGLEFFFEVYLEDVWPQIEVLQIVPLQEGACVLSKPLLPILDQCTSLRELIMPIHIVRPKPGLAKFSLDLPELNVLNSLPKLERKEIMLIEKIKPYNSYNQPSVWTRVKQSMPKRRNTMPATPSYPPTHYQKLTLESKTDEISPVLRYLLRPAIQVDDLQLIFPFTSDNIHVIGEVLSNPFFTFMGLTIIHCSPDLLESGGQDKIAKVFRKSTHALKNVKIWSEILKLSSSQQIELYSAIVNSLDIEKMKFYFVVQQQFTYCSGNPIQNLFKAWENSPKLQFEHLQFDMYYRNATLCANDFEMLGKMSKSHNCYKHTRNN